MYGRVSLVFIIPFLLAPSLAQAANPEARERAARRACLAGDYTKGVSILSDLFLDTKDPNYVYNQGRCLELNGRYEEAILRFHEYLRTATKPSNAEKLGAQKHIADCQGLLAKQKSESNAPATALPVSPAAEPAVRQEAVQPAPPMIMQQATPPSRSTAGSGLRISGVLAASIGGAALVAGIVLNFKVNSMASDFETRGGYTRSKGADRATYETLGWVSYGVGAACVATGSLLYYLGWRAGAGGSASLVLVPEFATGTTGAVLRGTF